MTGNLRRYRPLQHRSGNTEGAHGPGRGACQHQGQNQHNGMKPPPPMCPQSKDQSHDRQRHQHPGIGFTRGGKIQRNAAAKGEGLQHGRKITRCFAANGLDRLQQRGIGRMRPLAPQALTMPVKPVRNGKATARRRRPVICCRACQPCTGHGPAAPASYAKCKPAPHCRCFAPALPIPLYPFAAPRTFAGPRACAKEPATGFRF